MQVFIPLFLIQMLFVRLKMQEKTQLNFIIKIKINANSIHKL